MVKAQKNKRLKAIFFKQMLPDDEVLNKNCPKPVEQFCNFLIIQSITPSLSEFRASNHLINFRLRSDSQNVIIQYFLTRVQGFFFYMILQQK